MSLVAKSGKNAALQDVALAEINKPREDSSAPADAALVGIIVASVGVGMAASIFGAVIVWLIRA